MDRDEATIEQTAPDLSRGRSPLLFFCWMAVLGVVLALFWRYAGQQLSEQLWASFKPSQSSAALTAQTSSLTSAQVAELNALKAEAGRLTAANGQMTAEIAALQQEIRELGNRAAAPASITHLFSNPALLRLQIVPGAGAAGTISRAPASLPAARKESRGRATPKVSNAPLVLPPRIDRP